MSDPLPDPPSSDEAEFARQAERAGLTLPRRRSLDLRWVSIVLVAVVAASLGIGQWSGWAVGPRHVAEPAEVYGPQNCVGAPSAVTAHLPGVVASDEGPGWAASVGDLGSAFSNWSGGCIHLAISTSAGDGYSPELADRGALFVLGPALPTPADRANLSARVAVVPAALVAVEIVYDLPGLSKPLQLNGSVLAGIYEGSITSWGDPRIAALNPGLNLSSEPSIVPVYRTDPTEDNQVLTTLLAETNRSWASAVGIGPTVAWPDGRGVSGPSAMENTLETTPGAVGYLESEVPPDGVVRAAWIQSAAGPFVGPGAGNVTSAAAALAADPALAQHDWANASLVDAPGASSYPLDELVYATVYQDLGTAYTGNLSLTNATWLLSFLWWSVTNGTAGTPAAGLAALPNPLVGTAQQVLENETYDGHSILEANEPSGGETGEF